MLVHPSGFDTRFEASVSQDEAWDSIEIDTNFCFAEIVPWMDLKGRKYAGSLGDEGTYFANFFIPGYDKKKDTDIYAEGPNIETAIAQAFLNYIHSTEEQTAIRERIHRPRSRWDILDVEQLQRDAALLDDELTRVEAERDNALEMLRSMEHGAQGIYEDAKLRASEKLKRENDRRL